MTVAWVRVDDGFTHHPKIVKLSRAERWTWLEVLCYAARFRTGGVVPVVVGEVVRGASPAFLERCHELRLLDLKENGSGDYVVHDWDDYNGRDPKVMQTERQRKRRDTAVTNAVTPPVQERDKRRDETVTRAQARARVPQPQPLRPTETPTGVSAELAIPTNTRTVIATVVDVFAAKGVPLSERHRGMLAKQAKDLLTSGFDEQLVALAAVTAERRGEPQNMHFIANDLAMTRAGERMTRREYEKALEDEMEVGLGAA